MWHGVRKVGGMREGRVKEGWTDKTLKITIRDSQCTASAATHMYMRGSAVLLDGSCGPIIYYGIISMNHHYSGSVNCCLLL